MVGNKDYITKKTVSLDPLIGLKPYILRYKHIALLAVLSLFTAALVTLMVPLGLKHIIDLGFSSKTTTVINDYYIVMILLAGVLALASAARYYFVNWLGEKIIADLRSDIFSKMTTLSAEFFSQNHSGEVMSRLTADTTQIKTAISLAASQTLRNIIMIFGSVIMMFLTSFYLSCLVIIAIPLIIIPLITCGRIVKRLSRKAQDTIASASAYAGESLSEISTLQAFTNEKNAASHYKEAVDLSFEAARQRNRARAGLTAIAIFLVFTCVISILWLGAQEVVLGAMTPGTLGQFILYSILAAGALGEMSEVWGEIQQASGAAERLIELLQQKQQIQQPANPKKLPEPVSGKIILEDVHFTYPLRDEKTVLGGVSVKIEPGEHVAIVGPSGAGKSTVFNLLLRFYDLDSGRILIDGIEIDELCLKNLRQKVAIVPQNTALFSGTIYENIAYGSPDVTHDQVVALLKQQMLMNLFSNCQMVIIPSWVKRG